MATEEAESDRVVRELLEQSRVVAVVGLSADEEKPSNVVARYLKNKGYRVIPVNPGQSEILGEKSYKSLSDIKERVDIVDIFMRAEKVLPVVEEALALGPLAVWLQLGIRSEEAKALAKEKGVLFIMDRCVKIEHTRLVAAT